MALPGPCNLTTANFVLAALVDDAGNCRTPGCQYGAAGRHPAAKQRPGARAWAQVPEGTTAIRIAGATFIRADCIPPCQREHPSPLPVVKDAGLCVSHSYFREDQHQQPLFKRLV
eukprot:gnl/Hemi2/21603_TR7195_c0_g2_i2.p2 gnl/Hemi2/21603_TR7195_c0_g2~~gnl/Hemi2/21603_TR7195_c0_g2_i2.p2  ORF type:complete len:115 (+),score=13.07 gnl/Hemi2/21603_TR7195_c0_g2_i2:128-472(+)